MPQSARAVRTRVGRSIQRLRHLRGLSQARLAELTGRSEKQIGEIEFARANVGLNTLARIAAALSVDVTDLFTQPAGRNARMVMVIAREDVESLSDLVKRLKRTHAPRTKRPAQ